MTIAIRIVCKFEQVSRYVSYRDPRIAIRIVSRGYRIVTPLLTPSTRFALATALAMCSEIFLFPAVREFRHIPWCLLHVVLGRRFCGTQFENVALLWMELELPYS